MTANPVHDQLEAAADDAARIFKEAHVSADESYKESSVDDGSIAATVSQRFMDSLESDSSRMCPHIRGPQPIYGAACLPGLVACHACMQPLIAAQRLMQRMQGGGLLCDGCGGTYPRGHDGLINRGPLLLGVNLCCTCLELNGGEDGCKGDIP